MSPCCCFCSTTERLGRWYGNTTLEALNLFLDRTKKSICADCAKNLMDIMRVNNPLVEIS